MLDPTVTCAFTTYNAEDTIESAIYSAINQSFKDIEIIIVDDCSTDNTFSIIKNIAKITNLRIKFFPHDSNKGVAEARNSCIKYAAGEFICFFDDDDQSHQDRIEKQLERLIAYERSIKNNNSNSTTALCYGDRLIHYENRSPIFCRAISTTDVKIHSEAYAKALLSAGAFPMKGKAGSSATCTLFARRKLFLDLNLFNPELRRCEDLDLAIKAVINKVELISTNSLIVNQYYTDTLDKKGSYIYEFKILKIHEKWLKKRNLYEFAYLYLKLKDNLFEFKICNFLKLAFIIFLKYPINASKKLMSSLSTILFTLKYRFKI